MTFQKGYKQTKEHKRKLSEAHKGKKFTKEHKRNLSISHKSQIPYVMTEQIKRKISDTLKKNHPRSFLGKHHSKEAKRKMSEARKGKPHFNQRGEKSNFWKGGVTPINQKIRSSLGYKIWRESIFKRDNWTCIWCGAKKNLNADHIKPFALFPELRFVIDNGRTLCHDCHKKTDTYLGKIKNYYNNILIEKEPEYVKICKERIRAISNPLF